MKLAKYLERQGVTQSEFARTLGVTPGLVWQWLNKHRPIAPQKALLIEEKTSGAVTRHELRPDVYPRDNAA
jgi:DNA-binding transcriptional regulator YdaS (Cro superfamily)